MPEVSTLGPDDRAALELRELHRHSDALAGALRGALKHVAYRQLPHRLGGGPLTLAVALVRARVD